MLEKIKTYSPVLLFLLAFPLPAMFLLKEFPLNPDPTGEHVGEVIFLVGVFQIFLYTCLLMDLANEKFLFNFVVFLLILMLGSGIGAVIIGQLDFSNSHNYWAGSWIPCLIILFMKRKMFQSPQSLA